MPEVPVEQKLLLTGGLDFWHTHPLQEVGLPSIMLTDGPHGLRKQSESAGDHVGLGASEPATCFPPAVGLSCSWDRNLLGDVGEALGKETRAYGVGVLLGPGANIKRDPRCGRNFEYFSEDPFLTGELAAAYVRGVQSQGVGTSLKHFAANNQETDRMRRDSQIDERTLREIYLRAFGKVVTREQPWTVMCSYNKLNGVQVSENHWLLTEVLKDEWGFDGLVVSDWGAVWDRVRALQAGLDLEMPANAEHEASALAALASGELSADTVEAAYARVERVLRRAADSLADAPHGFDVDAHHALARRAATECVVLLDNDGILPLRQETRVAVIGEFARTPRYQGAGSSRVTPTRLDNALDAIRALAGCDVPFAPGFATGPDQQLPADAADQAVTVAADADVALVFLGLGEAHESEGYDREDLDLPAEQLELLERVLQVNDNVVVILSNGSSVLVPFAGRVRAVVEGWLLGQAGGPALADILYGRVNPSGKITETIPKRLQDAPSYLNFPGDATGVRYGEGVLVGYRGYDWAETEVAYPFGHGLSYTTFAYGDLEVSAAGNDVTVGVTITNTGPVPGREIVQVYVGKPESEVVRPIRELKGFGDVTLAPGASERLQVRVPADELAYWSVQDGRFVVEGGDYVVEVGSSSRDLRARAGVRIEGDRPYRRLTLATSMAEALAVPGFGDEVLAIARGVFASLSESDGLGTDAMRMMGNMPLVALAGFSGTPTATLQHLMDAVNAEHGLG